MKIKVVLLNLILNCLFAIYRLFSKSNYADKNMMEYISDGKYEEAEEYLLAHNKSINGVKIAIIYLEETHKIILGLVGFTYYMMLKHIEEDYNEVFSMVVDYFICDKETHFKGLDSVRLYGKKKAIAMRETIDNLEWLLYDDDDDRLEGISILDTAERKMYAERMLQFDSECEYAKKVLSEFENTEDDIITDDYMEYDMEKCLIHVKYELVEEHMAGKSMSEIRKILMDYARQSESMAVCGFIQYMIEKTDSNEWIQLQIDVMTQCLECMKKYGIDSVIKFYTRLLEKRKCN